MRRWTISVLFVFCVTFPMFGTLWAQSDVLTLKSKKGDITYPHKKHTDTFKCLDCHHKTKAGERPKACRECHKKGEAVTAMKAFHSKEAANSCRGCHEKQGKGPKYSPCSNCHKK